MDGGVAFGAGKAGAPFDPIGFVTRPTVILRFLCWLFSVIVFGCISNKGWHENKCLFNKDGNACRFASLVGTVGFVAAIALLILEALFQNISSIKVRRRAVALDMGFSGLWAGLYLIVFAYLGIAWAKSDAPFFGYGINNARAAIAFAFFSIPVWAGCAYFAHIKWLAGADMGVFTSGFDEMGGGPTAEYSAYAGGTETGEANYGQAGAGGGGGNPFQTGGNYQAPAY